jgi:predicted benzoate:H+ symporter BenE
MDIDFSGLWNNGLVFVAVGAVLVCAALLTLCGVCELWQGRKTV